MKGPHQGPDFETLFRQEVGFVYRVLRYLGVRSADVHDIAQEVFLVVHRKLPDFEPRAPVRAWLYGVCRRTVSDHRRKASFRMETPCAFVAELPQDPAQEGAVETRLSLERLHQALSELEQDQRQVFVLYEIEGFSMKEISETMECPLQTAYWRLHAARARVRSAFGLDPEVQDESSRS